jgi:hypothetical protein
MARIKYSADRSRLLFPVLDLKDGNGRMQYENALDKDKSRDLNGLNSRSRR